MTLVEKKNFKQNFGDFAKNCPLYPMSLPSPPPRIFKIFRVSPSLARGTLVDPTFNYYICKKDVVVICPLLQTLQYSIFTYLTQLKSFIYLLIFYILLQPGMPRLPHARGTDSENFQISRGGVNSSDLIDNFWRSPQNLKNFFFNKNHNFLKFFAKFLLKSQRGDQRKHF